MSVFLYGVSGGYNYIELWWQLSEVHIILWPSFNKLKNPSLFQVLNEVSRWQVVLYLSLPSPFSIIFRWYFSYRILYCLLLLVVVSRETSRVYLSNVFLLNWCMYVCIYYVWCEYQALYFFNHTYSSTACQWPRVCFSTQRLWRLHVGAHIVFGICLLDLVFFL